MTTNHSKSERVTVETLIVGFGFSVIPLLRELEARGQPYTLLSSGPPIWQQLADSDRLDFDLVSSFHASFYAEDQVEADVVDNYYPTAREFYEYHERLFAQFRHKVIEERVVSVDNHHDHSVVHTASGQQYQTRNLVFATGLGRPQNETIKQLDLHEMRDQTLVFNAIGDTTNMMLAKAIPQGNRAILLNNGFITLDKYIVFDAPGPKGSGWYIPLFGVRTGKRYAIDLAQIEFHTIGRLWPKFYKDLFSTPLGPPDPDSFVARTILPHVFHVRFPETYRARSLWSNQRARAPFGNGMIGIKYWPIDMYEQRFGDELEERMRQGVLLNDIVFFHLEGLVETWSKDRTSVDLDNKTISCDGKTVSFDHFIDGGTEEPRLPVIVSVDDDGNRHTFQYDHRDSYLGVVPAALRNVFFIGYTRPFTGGLANITEMQGLMVHKLLSDPERTEALYEDLHERIATYNDYNYAKKQLSRATDHLVHYGFYTDTVARFIGIDRKVSSAFSWRPYKSYLNLRFELLHPNNALKFRMEGEYAVEGADTLARKIAAHNEHWSILQFLLLSVLWDHLLGYLCLLLLWLRYGVQPIVGHGGVLDVGLIANLTAWSVLCVTLGVLFRRNHRVVNMTTYSLTLPLFGLKAMTQPLAMIYIAMVGDWWLCLLLFGVWCVIAFAFRQFHRPPISGRYLFADCKYKHAYRPFWERYKEAYGRMHAAKRSRSDAAGE